MTRLFTIIVICFIYSNVNAQPSMLGKTAKDIKAFNLTQQGIANFEYEETQNDSTTYLQFVDKEDTSVEFRYYINKNGICDDYVILQPKTQMLAWIHSLNESYTKVQDKVWVSKSLDMQIEIFYLSDDKKFTTSFFRFN